MIEASLVYIVALQYCHGFVQIMLNSRYVEDVYLWSLPSGSYLWCWKMYSRVPVATEMGRSFIARLRVQFAEDEPNSVTLLSKAGAQNAILDHSFKRIEC